MNWVWARPDSPDRIFELISASRIVFPNDAEVTGVASAGMAQKRKKRGYNKIFSWQDEGFHADFSIWMLLI